MQPPSRKEVERNTLLCWIGHTDTKAATEKDETSDGPIRMLLRHEHFDRIRLLCTKNQDTNKIDALKLWLKPYCTEANMDIITTDVTDPIDFVAVYRATLACINEICPDSDGRGMTFHVSPGTFVMQSVLLLLARLRYPKTRVVQTRKEQFASDGKTVLEVNLPKEIDFASGRRELPSDQINDGTEQGQHLEEFAKQVAKTPLRVLLLGESGSGKSYLARLIHEWSGRLGKLVPINCAGLPDTLLESELFGHVKGAFTGASTNRMGAFQAANNGTLFLDEIGEMPLTQQAALLRALQEEGDDYTVKIHPVGDDKEKEVNVRIIAATNRPLIEAVQTGRFREDLYYRLAEVTYNLPSIFQYSEENRKKLLYTFLNEINERHNHQWDFSPTGWRLLQKDTWPGNIREMRFMIRRLCFLARPNDIIPDVLVKQQLSQGRLFPKHGIEKNTFFPLGNGQNLDECLQNMRMKKIEEALEQTNGNKAKAAHLLGIPYQRLIYWIRCRKEEY